MKKKKYTRITNTVLLILSIFTIYLFSSEKGSDSKNTSQKVAKEVISIVIKKEDNKIEDFVNNNIKIIRKLAHFTEFFILGLFITNIIKDYIVLSYKTVIISVILACIFACTDEIHQIFVSGRTARIFDVFVDTIGSFLGSLIYYIIYKKVSK